MITTEAYLARMSGGGVEPSKAAIARTAERWARIAVRLRRMLKSERRLHGVAKAFHDLAVAQRNAAWREGEVLTRQRDTALKRVDELKAENAELRAELERYQKRTMLLTNRIDLIRGTLDGQMDESIRIVRELREKARREANGA